MMFEAYIQSVASELAAASMAANNCSSFFYVLVLSSDFLFSTASRKGKLPAAQKPNWRSGGVVDVDWCKKKRKEKKEEVIVLHRLCEDVRCSFDSE